MRDAVRKLREQSGLEPLRELLAVGLKQIKNGEGIPYSADFMGDVMRQAEINHKAGKPIPDEVKPANFEL